MTSRLKKKLGDLGVDTSSRRANENFCLIGTPLPPLEKSKDTGEFVPLWKQEVRDEKGRRRLHGAFTGGFSAGYFNTVGSKEGWAPSTFVSSRSERAKKVAARPEDFMDEEDLQDLKDSKQIVDTTEEMDFLGGTQAALRAKEADDSDKDPLTRTLEASLLPAPKDSIGAKILKKMGWRLGQGIGPRVTLKKRKQQDALAYDPATGARYQAGTLDISEDDEEANKHTYAPRDTPVLVVKKKENTHGLGYVPGTTLQESLGNGSAGSSKGPRLAGGFGLGALNDADEDDLDVYDIQNQGSRHRVAYDLIGGDDDEPVLLGSKAAKQSKSTGSSSTSTRQYLRDGRPVLAGFVLSDEPVAEDRWFPVPEIPPGWQPDPRRVWAADKENIPRQEEPPREAQSHAQWKRPKISADQRGAMLGETPLPPAQRSVFDYMSQKDKERIQNISANLKSFSSTHPAPTSSHPSADVPSGPPSISTTRLESHIAQAALVGFQPFTTNPQKQARYTAFLRSQAIPDAFPPLQQVPGQKTEEFNKEVEDYAKAASLFKPVSGAMAGRFTSAAVLEMGPVVQEGLHTPSNAAELKEKEEEARRQREKEEEERISPKVHAAKAGMYGPLTREKKPWVPVRLLCKRFGVKEPDVNLGDYSSAADDAGAGPSAPASGKTVPAFTKTEAEQKLLASAAAEASSSGGGSSSTGPRDLSNVGLGEDETQGRNTLTYERPPMDLFKAIFASDDEDDDDADKTADEDEEQPVVVNGAATEEKKGFTPATKILDDEPITDISTFKPKFVPREGKSKDKDKDKSKEKRDKKEKKDKKKKEKKGVLVSFDMDEGMGGDEAKDEVKQPKDRPKKKRKEEHRRAEDGDEGVMFESAPTAPPVPAAKAAEDGARSRSDTPNVVPQDSNGSGGGEAQANKGRKRAIDFM